jgi:hypothetical protein
MKRDGLHNDVKYKNAISALIQTNADTAFTSKILDMQNSDSAELVIQWGAVTDANVTFAVVLSESDDSAMSGATAVADADLLGTEAGAMILFSQDDDTSKIGYVGIKRYIQAVLTPTGNNSGDINIAAIWVQGMARDVPQTAQIVAGAAAA